MPPDPSQPSPPRLIGIADAEGPIWTEAAFRRDPWARPAATAEPGAGPLIVSKARFVAERAQLLARAAPLGLHLESGAAVDDLAPDVTRFALIALDFPKFSDGRSFSTARLLREKYGFAGELRAVGNVLADQIPFLRRVGFDAFEVTHLPTRRALSAGRIAEVRLHYQPALDAAPALAHRPWLRKSPA